MSRAAGINLPAWAVVVAATAGLGGALLGGGQALPGAMLVVCLAAGVFLLARPVTPGASRSPRAGETHVPAPKPAPAGPTHPDVLESTYEILEEVGRGSMGTVHRARHKLLDRVVALKRIRSDSVDAEDVARFRREARATAALSSPHTVELFDFGECPGGFYYVMEYLDGTDLQRLIRVLGPMPPARAVAILIQACHSLAEAHAAGVVHRDVKPANLMLCRYGLDVDFVKLVDFGLAKAAATSRGTKLTADSTVLGTAAYIAPESLKGSAKLDSRADIYALGAILFWLITGKLLFNHTNPVLMARAHLSEPAPKLSEHSPVPIPAELDDVMAACLEKSPDDRPATALDLRRRLQAIALTDEWTTEDATRWWQLHFPA